ncbi:MAG TPA: Calx-beta domain-containing protein [Acidimicrobiales bacterium]|nr:Calx-beta domain-containing protein [Acidimicrobiales bacterium]
MFGGWLAISRRWFVAGLAFFVTGLGLWLSFGQPAHAALVCTHNAVADGGWGDAATWDTATVPNTASAVACIDSPRTVTFDDTTGSLAVRGIKGTGTLVMSDTAAPGAGATLTLSDTVEISTIGALNISEGKLTGPSNLTVNGPFTWTGGAIGATQTSKTITITGLTTLGGATKTIDNRRIVLNGNTTWTSGDIVWNRTNTSFSDQILTVGAGTVFDITATSDVSATGTNFPSFTVNGTLRKSGLAPAVLLATSIDNAGTLEALAGKMTLGVRGTGNLLGAGSWTSGADATLELRGGTTNTLAGPINGPGTILVTAPTTSLTGVFGSAPQISTQNNEGLSPSLTIGPGGSGNPEALALGPSGTATISRSLTMSRLTQSGGTLAGGSALTTGMFDWTGGLFQRPSTSTTVTGATNLGGTSKNLVSGSLTLNGTTTWSAGSISSSASASVLNSGSFVINAPDGAVFGPAAFVNSSVGVIRRAGTGRVAFAPPLMNQGRVEVTSGTFALTGCYSDVGSAAWAISAGATLEVSNPFTCTPTLDGTLDGPGTFDVNISGSNVTVRGPISNAPAVVSRAGGVQISNFGSGSPRSIMVTGGTASSARPLFVDAVTLAGGTLANGSTLNVGAGGLAWSGGTLSGTGTTSVNGPLAMTGSAKTLNVGQTLDLFGGATWTAGNLSLGSTIRNNAGTFSIAGPTSLAVTRQFNTGAVFQNLPGAVLDLDVSVVLDLAIDNDGSVTVDGGDLTFGSTSSSGGLTPQTSTGTFTVGSGRTLTFASGAHTLAGTINGAGSVAVTGGNHVISGTLNSLPLNVSSGGLTLAPSAGGPGNVTLGGGALASLTVPNAVSFPSFNHISGGLNGTGALTIGTFEWSGGTHNLSTTVTGQSTLTGATKTLDTRPLTFNGPVNWSLGDIQLAGGATMVAADAFDVAATVGSPTVMGVGIFQVTGTLTRDRATGTPVISAPLDNDGVVSVLSGVLRIGDVVADSSGAFQVEEGGGTRLEFHAPGLNASVIVATPLVGPGIFRSTQGTVAVRGALVDTPTLETSGVSTLEYAPASGAANLLAPAGTINVHEAASAAALTLSGVGAKLSGDGELSTETLNWTSGEMLGAGSTVVTGAATLDGPNLKALTQRSLVLNGATTWVEGTLRVSEAVVTNNGSLDVAGDAARLFDRATGSLATFENGPDGVITRSGAGLLTLEGAINNNGVVSAAAGDIKVGDNSTTSSSPGEWLIPAGRTVTFAGPGDTLSGVIAGPGAMKFTAGNYTVAAILVDDPAFTVGGGTITLAPATGVIGALSVTAGTLLVPEDLSASSLSMTAGTITGAGDLTVGAFGWQRGIMSGSAMTTVNGPLTLSTAGKKTLGGRTLATNGATTWSNGALSLVNASIVNAGEFVVSAPVSSSKSGTASFVNAPTGVLRRTGTGVATLAPRVTNNGTIDVADGTLTLNGGLSNLSGGTLTGGTYVLNGILKAGAGGITTNAATIRLGSGEIQPLSATSDSILDLTSNSGTLELLSGAFRDLSSESLSNSGAVIVNQSAILNVNANEGTLANTATGVVSGGGAIFSTVTGGSVRPGASPGVLTARNLDTTPAGSKVQIELGGTAPGTEHDKVEVFNELTLGGTLEVSFVNGFVPASNSLFTILSAGVLNATFANVVVPAGSPLAVRYTPNSVVLFTPPHHLAVSPANTAVLAGVGQTYTAEAFDAANVSRGDITAASTFTIDGSPCSGNVCSSASTGVHTVTATSAGATGSGFLHVLAAQPNDVADYAFNNNLSSAFGSAPDLGEFGADTGQPAPAFATETVFNATRPVRTFGSGGGFALSPTTSVVPSATYTLLLEFRLTTVAKFRKLIDFASGNVDAGLYVHDGKLRFFGLTGDLGTAMVAGTYHDVAISRDGAGNVELYLDGTALGTFADPGRLAVIDSAAALRLFRDDDVTAASEHSAGAVSRFRLFDHRLAPAAIPGLKTAALSAASVTVAEGSGGGTGPVNVTVTLAPASSMPVTVHFATDDGTAKVAASDYAAASGNITFAPGETTKTVPIDVSRDALYEANETFSVQLSNPVGAVFKTAALAKSTVTLTNDDAKPSLSINDVSITEGNSGTRNLVFTVTLSAVSGKSVAVDVATLDGSASAGSDYTATSTRMTIPAGALSKTFVVPIIGDTAAEPVETFSVKLTNPTDATITDTTGIGTINNDDD